MCLKLKYPECITLLRGNHESVSLTTTYGLYDEVQKKYGNVNAWKYCCDVFQYLPLAALIEDSIMCVHGGISPQIIAVDQISVIDRFVKEPGHNGAMTDLLWSDPEPDIKDWAISPRGSGWLFG